MIRAALAVAGIASMAIGWSGPPAFLVAGWLLVLGAFALDLAGGRETSRHASDALAQEHTARAATRPYGSVDRP